MTLSEVVSQVVLPSLCNADELAQKDVLQALSRVENCQDAESAKIYVTRAIETGKPHYNFKELIHAIEQRLPEPTPYQISFVTFLRQKTTGVVMMGRALGAFDDQVLVLAATQRPAEPFCLILLSVPDNNIELPDWDVTRSAERRVWLPAEEVAANV